MSLSWNGTTRGSTWALRSHAHENEISETETNRHGTRFVIDGAPHRAGRDSLEREERLVYRYRSCGAAVHHCASFAEAMKTIHELDAVALTCDLPATA